MADYSELKRKAQEIRNEVKAGANTANRVGLAIEELTSALEAENQRAEQADKSVLETTNKAVEGKQDKLHYYTENTSTDTAVIKVSHDTDEATLHEDKVEVGVDNCVLLKSEDLLLGEDSYIKVSPEKVSMSSPQGKIEDVVGAVVSNANAIATLNGTGEGSVSKKVTDEIAKVIANAPADFDTLKEIADYIASDKTNAAEINNTLAALTTRVYELGDFPTSEAAEKEARDPKISGNDDISIIHYTVNGTTDGLILQHQDVDNTYYRSLQTLLYHSRMKVRFVWFTDSTRTALLENANFNRDWWETSISHLEYDKATHTIMCRRIGQDVNRTKWLTLPSASTSTDGLMTKAQVESLEGKQDTLRYYTENTSTDTAVIKVLHDTDEATLHEDKVEVGVDNCVLLKSEDLLLGEESYIKVSPEKVSMSSSEGMITDLIQTIRSLEARIANLEAQLTNTTEEQ